MREVTFTATPEDPGHISDLAWDLDGDGQFDDAQGPVAKAIFTSEGTWVVRLRVSDDRGQSATAARRLEIRAASGASVTATKKRAKRPCATLKGTKLRTCRTQRARRLALAKCRRLNPKGAVRTRCERKARGIGATKRRAAARRR
jgi:hypothetical protein